MELTDQQINDLAGFILKQQQLNVIRSYCRKADTIFCAPTGYGKSITYQLAPKLLAGKAIVVTPLLSLLQDSIRNSSRFGKCTDLSSASTDNTSDHIHSDLVFTTAESLIEGAGRELLKNHNFTSQIKAIFIDEAHVIHSYTEADKLREPFRATYSRLGELRSFIKQIPFIALTATATQEVLTTISKSLDMTNPTVFNVRTDKTNISYYVQPVCNDVPLNFSWIVNLKKDMFSGRILVFFKNLEQTGVVYDFVTTNIKQSPSDVTKTVHMYHSQTNPDRKKAIVDSLSRPLAVGEMTVVLCTSSFSLGLNLRDIEYVVHYGLPHSLTDYVQETGRAAREPTTHGHAIILAYDKMSVGTKVERAMQEVAKTKMCRRDCIMSYFRLTPSPNVKCCDICNPDLAELCPIIPYIRVNREQTGEDTISTVTPSYVSTPSLSSISDMSD